jgi:hypothetical protein
MRRLTTLLLLIPALIANMLAPLAVDAGTSMIQGQFTFNGGSVLTSYFANEQCASPRPAAARLAAAVAP